MADYNVQMKQYNGTSFDNILPYASQALTLAGGGGATEIIAQARAGLSQIATGSYVGTGTQGIASNPIILSIGFKPQVLILTKIDTIQSDRNVLWKNGLQVSEATEMTGGNVNASLNFHSRSPYSEMPSAISSVVLRCVEGTNSGSLTYVYWMSGSNRLFTESVLTTVSFDANVNQLKLWGDSYVSFDKYPTGQEYAPKSPTPRQAFNLKGITYYYMAIAEQS